MVVYEWKPLGRYLYFDNNVRDLLLKLNWCGAEDYVTYTKPWFSGHSNRRRTLPPLAGWTKQFLPCMVIPRGRIRLYKTCNRRQENEEKITEWHVVLHYYSKFLSTLLGFYFYTNILDGGTNKRRETFFFFWKYNVGHILVDLEEGLNYPWLDLSRSYFYL